MKHVESLVSRETQERLALLVELLMKWNATVNLVSAQSADEVWTRHVADSAQLLSFIPPSCDVAADLGSGGGFPGLVLAIMSNVRFNLIESDKRKAAFLTHAAQLTHARVAVHATRIETCELRNFDLVTSRALAPVTKLVAYAEPLLAPAGICLFLKGKTAGAELEEAEKHWRMRVARTPSQVQADGEILRIDRIFHV